jgi:hypothetical protein
MSRSKETIMQALIRASVLTLAALAMTAGPIAADARPYGHGGYGYHGHGGWGHGGWGHGGRFWGGLGIGLGVGVGLGYYYGAPWYPGYVVAAPVYEVGTVPSQPIANSPPANSPPDPVIYPRNGQSSEQTEADRQACNRWATTQPAAMADASVFQRAAAACMEGRGYTVR